jgi:hypothetical protein
MNSTRTSQIEPALLDCRAASCLFLLLSLLAITTYSIAQQNAWFLLIAPNSKDGFRVNAPLPEWRHIASFDSAKECEARRKAIAATWKTDSTIDAESERDRFVKAYAASKCIPIELIKEWMK